MKQENDTTELLKNKHLPERQRYTIEDLLKEGRGAKYIENRLGKGIRTIEREIKKGTVTLRNTNLREYKMYCADAGQIVYEENAKNKVPMLKVGKAHKLVKYIEKKIIEDKYTCIIYGLILL